LGGRHGDIRVGVKETSNLGCLILPHHSDFVVVLCNNIMRKTLTALVSTLGIISSLAAPSHAVTRCGSSSFYGSHGDNYAWRTTASGEAMNPGAMTTAHRTLPFGTKLLVTNQSNGKSVVVRVNDRGPYAHGRILDLSSGAFGIIASHSSGVANVCYTRL